MLQFIELGSEQVVGFRIEGKVSNEDFDKVAALIQTRLESHNKLRIYAEVAEFEGIALDALFKDLKFALGHWSRFDKEAVVTDKSWLQTASEFAGKLLPHMEVRAFPTAQVDAARKWIIE